MSYEQIGEAAKATNFQNRCWGSTISMCHDILAAPQDSGAIMDDAVPPNDLTSEASKAFAKKLTRGQALTTREIIANHMLLNNVVANDPMECGEDTIQYQTKQIWVSLVGIG